MSGLASNLRPTLRRAARPRPFATGLWMSLVIVLLFWTRRPITLAFDPGDDKCLPDLHLALLIHTPPADPRPGDLVFWPPQGALGYVHQEFVLKMVAARAGDHVQVHDGSVSVNGRVVATGLPLATVYRRTPAQFERDNVVAPGHVFVMGTNPNSDDSRYWGDLDVKALAGSAHKVF
jgi:conjugal transfer pilin signal peptidase TrbI